jgi:multisite-specific tRNA:(cytosine-C5)-methyltransferase
VTNSALILRLFGEDITIAAREPGTKKRLATTDAVAPNEPNDLEVGDNEKDGDVDEDADADEGDIDTE